MRILLSWLFFLSSLVLVAQEEKITSFHSDITVAESGSLTVRETIQIYAAGDIFKRGITRALPLTRRDIDNNRIGVDYIIREVLVDGKPVNYFTEKEGGDLVVYVGERDRYLSPGNYRYEILYETAGQIGFFDDYDELSWNVNGLSGKTMDSVGAVVRLPAGADVISSHCYTGRQGSGDSNCTTETDEVGTLVVQANNLPSNEMLTLSVGFTKGFVTQPPEQLPRTFTWFERKGLVLLSSLFLVFLFAYYIYTWRRYGVDPPKPVVIPQFSPPDGLSPASVGMLYKGHYLDDFVTASIVNLSVKGFIRIDEVVEKGGLFGLRSDKRYALARLKEADDKLPAEEQIVMRSLFRKTESVTLTGKYDETIAMMMRDYHKSLKKQHGSVLNEGRNLKFHLVPWLAFIAYFIVMVRFVTDDLLQFTANRNALVATLLLGLVSYLLYAWLIVRPGERKLHYRSAVEGLKMYLDVAEEKQLQFFNPPEVTPALFEQLLPYAIALDMEKVWGDKFEKAFLSSALEPESYRPAWYGGRYVNAALFGHALNSTLSNTLSHAAMQPQSSSGGGKWSSGSFGGGFSGMGGGGGRVGGW
jgi:uncharacterized membrane protein YgcG